MWKEARFWDSILKVDMIATITFFLSTVFLILSAIGAFVQQMYFCLVLSIIPVVFFVSSFSLVGLMIQRFIFYKGGLVKKFDYSQIVEIEEIIKILRLKIRFTQNNFAYGPLGKLLGFYLLEVDGDTNKRILINTFKNSEMTVILSKDVKEYSETIDQIIENSKIHSFKVGIRY